MSRNFVIVALVFLVIVSPYWIYLPALFLATTIITFFWEGLLLALLIDTLYGTHLPGWGWGYTFSIIEVLLLILLLPLKDRLRSGI